MSNEINLVIVTCVWGNISENRDKKLLLVHPKTHLKREKKIKIRALAKLIEIQVNAKNY